MNNASWIPLRSVEACPPSPGYLMAVFVGYGDESGKQDDPEYFFGLWDSCGFE